MVFSEEERSKTTKQFPFIRDWIPKNADTQCRHFSFCDLAHLGLHLPYGPFFPSLLSIKAFSFLPFQKYQKVDSPSLWVFLFAERSSYLES